MTVVLAVVAVAAVSPLALALAAVCLLWRAAVLETRAQALLIRHQCERIDGYRAELDALSLAPPAAVAALTPDDPSLLSVEVEQWLRERTDR